jgi:predicted CXXCH cytochrome family protein
MYNTIVIYYRNFFFSRRGASMLIRIILLMLFLSVFAGLAAADSAKKSPGKGFVDSSECTECHAAEAQAWQGSHHDLAMQVANEQSVLGDFNDVEFTHDGEVTRFFRKAGKYYVNTQGPQGERASFEVKYTFGVIPLQQYMVELPKGKIQTLTVAWDSRPEADGGQRWFQLLPEEKVKPGDPLHWTGRAYNWNNRCAECHSTDLQKNYDPKTDTYSTTWSEINVTCQACHGPGEKHLAWARQAQQGEDHSKADMGLLVDYRNNDAKYQVESCARCHSRRHQVSASDSHGRPFLDDFMPSTLLPGLYHADGQILDEVYVYGSFLQSKMHQQGVRCSDCHDPHSNKLKLQGNALCVQCHSPASRPDFPTLQAKNYDSPEHHFHKQDGEAALCVSCHMPATTYMEVDPRRDHSFKIPSPKLTEAIGTPNACSGCHKDQSVSWATAAVEKWYGAITETEIAPAVVIAAARAGDPQAGGELAKLAGDPRTTPILAATALEHLRPYFPAHDALEPTLAALKHSDPLVRATAVSSLEQIPLKYRLSIATPYLDDPIRAVRIEAARVLAGMPALVFGEQQASFEKALQEYKELQMSLADTPEAHLNLGVMYTDQKQMEKAEQEYKQAIRLAPEFIPAKINLANLYNRMGRNHDAEEQFRAALELAPEMGELYYSFGLLLGEQKRYTESASLLEKAAELLPGRVRVRYNHALVLMQLKRYGDAEAALQKVLALSPDDADMIYAMVTLHTQQQQWQKALPYAARLVEVTKGEQGPEKILADIEEKLKTVDKQPAK